MVGRRWRPWIGAALVLAGCGLFSSDEAPSQAVIGNKSQSPKRLAREPEEGNTPRSDTPADADASCIPGAWNAEDISGPLRQLAPEELREHPFEKRSGVLIIEFGELDPSGRGEVVVAAHDLIHRMRFTRGDFRATVTHRMNGVVTLPYRPRAPGTIRLERPISGSLESHSTTDLGDGSGDGDPEPAPVELRGRYDVECTATQLTMWMTNRNGERLAPVHLRRLADDPAE